MTNRSRGSNDKQTEAGVSQLYLLLSATMTISIIFALGAQYLFDVQPCQKCVVIRFIILITLIVSIVRYIFVSPALSTSVFALTLYLLWTAYDNLFGEVFACGFGSPFPDWMPVDRWAPWLFEVRGLCGDHAGFPTFDHAVLALSVVAVGLSLAAMIVTIRRRIGR